MGDANPSELQQQQQQMNQQQQPACVGFGTPPAPQRQTITSTSLITLVIDTTKLSVLCWCDCGSLAAHVLTYTQAAIVCFAVWLVCIATPDRMPLLYVAA